MIAALRGTACAVAAIILCPVPAAAEEELEIEFHYRPDRSGNVVNQYLDVEEDEIEISQVDGARHVDIGSETFRELRAVVVAFLGGAIPEEGDAIAPPFVEVKMEYQSDSIEIEVARFYPEGQVPDDLVALQRQYFELPYPR